MNILFDSMGTQVQVQDETWDRLTTWIASLRSLGYTVAFTDYRKPLAEQLAGVDVVVSTTRHWALAPGAECHVPLIPKETSFSYSTGDLGALQTFVANGGGFMQFTNHSQSFGTGPQWPIYEIQAAAALGISLVFASFNTSANELKPAATCPPEIARGVRKLFSLDSGGIVRGKGTVLVELPDVPDGSGLGYKAADLAFAMLYRLEKGKVIVLGHSGITGNDGTGYPSQGQIGQGDNKIFLDNCIAYLGAH